MDRRLSDWLHLMAIIPLTVLLLLLIVGVVGQFCEIEGGLSIGFRMLFGGLMVLYYLLPNVGLIYILIWSAVIVRSWGSISESVSAVPIDIFFAEGPQT
jgi:hypothetical protein